MIKDLWYRIGMDAAFGFAVGIWLGAALVGIVFFVGDMFSKWRRRR